MEGAQLTSRRRRRRPQLNAAFEDDDPGSGLKCVFQKRGADGEASGGGRAEGSFHYGKNSRDGIKNIVCALEIQGKGKLVSIFESWLTKRKMELLILKSTSQASGITNRKKNLWKATCEDLLLVGKE